MERLKAGKRQRRLEMLIFTFQYGEIKRRQTLRYVIRWLSFTFQYGEIKRNLLLAMSLTVVLFTFQYGEIKSSYGHWNPTH